ncbi:MULTISPECIES: fasciclin domain-containing protein [Haloferax]|uniref:Fasciclin domain-containing protein n=1 Tax=Haloferax marinum TaxID=2666143 RepID=A0A6A8G3G0_9EURY|nr:MULTISPECIES: fasciclin domain-containing protein [Haloferax]KAB1196095.1 fasciclin domain-containing protein [Haloferax sp. CBA1150]MRW95078.1 fasciclin domain-containing protein [Haloferax marinum]
MTFNPDRRQALKTIGGAGLLLAGGAGIASAAPPRDGTTIVDIAIGSNPDEFNTLVAAVVEAGLVDALSGNRQLTVFAPTDEAFAALGVTPDNVGDIDFEAAVGASLAEILLYHVVPGRRKAQSVLPVSKLPTLNGAKIDVDGAELNDGQAGIIGTDIMASNGVIHVLDGVLLP